MTFLVILVSIAFNFANANDVKAPSGGGQAPEEYSAELTIEQCQKQTMKCKYLGRPVVKEKERRLMEINGVLVLVAPEHSFRAMGDLNSPTTIVWAGVFKELGIAAFSAPCDKEKWKNLMLTRTDGTIGASTPTEIEAEARKAGMTLSSRTKPTDFQIDVVIVPDKRYQEKYKTTEGRPAPIMYKQNKENPQCYYQYRKGTDV